LSNPIGSLKCHLWNCETVDQEAIKQMPSQKIEIEAESTIEPNTAAVKPPKSKTKRVRGNAIARLAKATAHKVRNNSDQLSDALFKRAMEGDVNCTKFLLTLIEKCPERKRKHRSMATELANSPEWKGPWRDAPAENYDDSEDYRPWENTVLAKQL
jgi:hypothetical protein